MSSRYIRELESFKLEEMYEIDLHTNDILLERNIIPVDFYPEYDIWKQIYTSHPTLVNNYILDLYLYIVEYIWINVKDSERHNIEDIYMAVDVYITEIMGHDDKYKSYYGDEYLPVDGEIFFDKHKSQLGIIINSVSNKKNMVVGNSNYLLKHWIIHDRIMNLIVCSNKINNGNKNV